MSRAVALGIAAAALIVLVVGVLLLTGGGDDGASSSPAPSGGREAPGGGAAPPGALDALPPGFVECMAEQGYQIQSPADIHSAPPQVLQACFGASH
jgi:hypothetical protein